jgi:hypothetical protein
MKALRILGWIIIPYIMIFIDWKKLNKNAKVLAFIWIGIVVVMFATNYNSDDKTVSSDNVNSTPAPSNAAPQNSEIPVAVLGEPLSSFDKVLGKANINETFHRYKDDYVLVMPIDDVAYNITVQFEATDAKRRTVDEALKIAKEFIPSDAVEVKQWQVEQGKDVIQYESKSIVDNFDKILFGESPAGTFIVIVKSDNDGVFSLVIGPGNNP